MMYSRTIWKARQGANLNRFNKSQEAADSVLLTNNPGALTVQGTAFTEERMNNIEEGITTALDGSLAAQVDGYGRDLMKLLLDIDFASLTTQTARNNAIAQVMAELRRRCNNNGEIDSSGIPDFRGLMVGDYLDGLDLSGIAAAPGGTAPQAWNNTYKNNRIVIAGFNFYKGAGSVENTKNHIVFVFKNNIAQGQMNSTDTNAGGYAASEMRLWLEGAAGDGSGVFFVGLKNAINGNYLYVIQKYEGNKDNPGWRNYAVFLPSEIEMFGQSIRGSDVVPDKTRGVMPPIQLPICQKSMVFISKKRNGAKVASWLSTAYFSNDTQFCMAGWGGATMNYASYNGNFSPLFCLA